MKNKHKKVIKLAKGFRGRAKNVYSVAVNRVEKALQYAYVGRKLKKRTFRQLWIQQVPVPSERSAGCHSVDTRHPPPPSLFL